VGEEVGGGSEEVAGRGGGGVSRSGGGEEVEEVVGCCVCGCVVSKSELEVRLLELKRQAGKVTYTTVYVSSCYYICVSSYYCIKKNELEILLMEL
jgi:hypothetical protein